MVDLFVFFFLMLFIFLGFGRIEDKVFFWLGEFDNVFVCFGDGRIKFLFLVGFFFFEVKRGFFILFWWFWIFLLFFLLLLLYVISDILLIL